MRADLRPRLSLVAALTAAALSAAALPALAEEAPAAPGPIGIGTAVTDDGQRGTFKVAAWTDAPQAKVTQVSARIRQGDTVLAEIPALAPGNTWDPYLAGRFLVPAEAALKLTEDGGTIPALGTYAIDVTATDSLGNTSTRTGAGTLDFRLRPQLTFGVGTPAWDDRNAHPQGTLVGIQPGSGDAVPLSGRTVTVEPVGSTPGSPTTAVTDETGAYVGGPLAVATPGWGTQLKAVFSEDSAEVHGSDEQYRYVTDVKPRTVTVTAAADKKRALSGETVTVSGRMTDPGAAGAPLADQPVLVSLGSYNYGTPYGKTVYTDADGRFSARLVAAAGVQYGEYWRVSSVDPYLNFAERGGAIAVPWESRIDLVGGGLTADSKVWVTGVFRPRYSVYSRSTSTTQYVQLEQSADGKTGWRKLSAATASADYWTTFYAGATSNGGYFRVRHLTTDEYAESVSRVFRLVRTPTRIAGMNAGPEPVAKGAYVTATGTLQHYTGGAWRVYGYAPVALQFQAKGTTTWRQVATGRTGAHGEISLKAKASVDGSWRIRYWGDSTHFHSPAPWADYVDVR
ncbi:hypothetical protein ACH4ZU_36175 [Streptomyces sp. NPDC020472]|uniref:hypothetical protein n=1 Tax=Streptomyces sp. NPDC020472 TaxID=3365075 RepID=UPI0037BB8BC0